MTIAIKATMLIKCYVHLCMHHSVVLIYFNWLPIHFVYFSDFTELNSANCSLTHERTSITFLNIFIDTTGDEKKNREEAIFKMLYM